MTGRDAWRQRFVLGAVTGGIISGATGDYGDARTSPSLVLPANYAFSVWGPIYAGAIGYAAYQGGSNRLEDPLLRRTGWLAGTSLGLSGLWVRAQDSPALQLPLIAATACTGVAAYLRALPQTESERSSASARWLVREPLGLYAGWITLATVAATTEVLIAQGYKAPPPGPEVWSSLALAGTAAAALAMDRRFPVAASYPAVLAWGFAAVAVRVNRLHRITGITAVLAAGAAAFAAGIGLRRTGQPGGMPPSLPAPPLRAQLACLPFSASLIAAALVMRYLDLRLPGPGLPATATRRESVPDGNGE